MIRVRPRSVGEGVESRINRFERSILSQISDKVVEVNKGGKYPVDTGAYMDSHTWEGESGQSSSGRPRGQSPQQYINSAKSRLQGQVSGHQAGQDKTLANNAPHAWDVEHTHGYGVYKQTAREFNNIIPRALSIAKGGTQ